MSKEEDKAIWGIVGAIVIGIFVLFHVFGNSKQELTKTENWEGVPIQVTTHFYDNVRSLGEAYRRLVDPEDEQTREGFAIWYQGEPECQIHTLRVRHQSDETRIETLGHEMLHCIIGTWHDEGVRR